MNIQSNDGLYQIIGGKLHRLTPVDEPKKGRSFGQRCRDGFVTATALLLTFGVAVGWHSFQHGQVLSDYPDIVTTR